MSLPHIVFHLYYDSDRRTIMSKQVIILVLWAFHYIYSNPPSVEGIPS